MRSELGHELVKNTLKFSDGKLMPNKKLYVLQAFRLEQKVPRAFDLYSQILRDGKDHIDTDNGFLYQITSKNEQHIDIHIERKRDPIDFPYIRNTKTQERKSMQEKLEPDEILAEKGRCSIFRDGIIIIEHNQYAGGSKSPIESLISYIENKFGEKHVKISHLYSRIALEEYIKEIKNGVLSFEVTNAAKLFGDYDLGEQNIVKQKIILQFKNGSNIVESIKRIVSTGVAELKSVLNKGSNGRARSSKGIHITNIHKEIKYNIDDDVVFNLMHEFKKELEMDKYLIMSKDQLTFLD